LTIKYYNYNKFGYYIKYYPVLYSKETKIALSRIKPGLVSILPEYIILVKYLENSSSNSSIKLENKYS
jgi:hypothetical protein